MTGINDSSNPPIDADNADASSKDASHRAWMFHSASMSVRLNKDAPENLAESLKILSPKDIALLMRSAAAEQVMPWLHALAEAGYYDMTPSPEVLEVSVAFRGMQDVFVGDAYSRISSLAEVMLMSKKVDHSSDAYGGDPIELTFGKNTLPLELLSINVNPEYFEFFQARVQAFVQQVKFIRRTSLGDSPTLVIGGLLMGMASAMNDPVSIRAIAEAMPHAAQVFLDTKRMGQKIGPDQSYSESLTPFAVAMLYGSLDAMKVLTDLGWSPEQTVCMRQVERKDPSQKPAPRQRFNAIEWIKFECDREGLFTFPSVIEWAILKSRPFSGPSSIQESVEHLVVDTIKNRQMDAILPALSRSGALNTIPNSFILTAIDHLNWAAVDAILPHVEWQKLTDQLKRLDPTVSTNAVLSSIIDNFPPVKLANKLNLTEVDAAKVDDHVAKLLQACIDAGSGSLLAFSGSANSPLRTMASNGLPRSMLLCLEQGADYNVKFMKNFPAKWSFTAEELAYESEPTEKVMRSFIALKEANQAVRDIRPSLA